MKRARPLLGTYVEIKADGLAPTALGRAIDGAFAAIDLVQRLMSFHDPDSDLSRINRCASREPVAVHPWTTMVLRRAGRLYEATDGLFDCAIGRELLSWGVLPPDGLDHVKSGDFRAVKLLPGNRVHFAASIALDLGGIAKGFAVDRAIVELRRHGIHRAVVNAGGDLRVMGDSAEEIFIRDPVNPTRLVKAGVLQNGAIATSSPAATLKRAQGHCVSALVRSHTREPLLNSKAYSVVAPTCVVADALTKVLVQLDKIEAPFLTRFGARGIIVPRASFELQVA